MLTMFAGLNARGRKVSASLEESAVSGSAEPPVFEVAIRRLKISQNKINKNLNKLNKTMAGPLPQGAKLARTAKTSRTP